MRSGLCTVPPNPIIASTGSRYSCMVRLYAVSCSLEHHSMDQSSRGCALNLHSTQNLLPVDISLKRRSGSSMPRT